MEQAEENSTASLDPTDNNVQAIARLEEEALHHRSSAERVSDGITKFMGSMSFVVLHLILFGVWFTANLNIIPGLKPFDPFPFGILTLIVSAEGVLLAIFVLISQNRMSRQADRRAHLDLQISILAEQELTMILKMQERICAHLGLDTETPKEEVQKLMEKTDVQRLVNEIEDKLPTD